MQARNTHQAIENTIDTILTKGGNTLYNYYLKEKLPNHANEQAQDLVSRHFNIAYASEPPKPQISKDNKPKKASIDTNTPQKVIH